MAEIRRVLKDDGVLVVTLDERWDASLPETSDRGWNVLEKDCGAGADRPFGMGDFIGMVSPWFVPLVEQ